MNASDLAARLHARRNPRGWVGRCPSHDDRQPSLSISEGRDGRVLVRCFSGCTPDEIVRAMGLQLADLFEAKTMPPAPISRRPTADDVERQLQVELGRILDREEAGLGFRPPALSRYKNEARALIERRLSVKLSRHRSPWWEIDPHCEDALWKMCIDRAVEEASWKHGVEPAWLNTEITAMPSVLDSTLRRARELQRELGQVA
jgi:hypothetical protein